MCRFDKIDLFMAALLGAAITILIVTLPIIVWPEHTHLYKIGVKATYKEAYAKGFMRKEIDNEDKVLYKWIEPPPLFTE